MKREILISSAKELHKLKSVVKRFQKIELKLPYLNDSENKIWEQLVHKEYFSCGCTTGSYFVGIGILLTCLYLIYTFIFELPISIKMIVITVVGCAVTGKLFGLFLAHIRLLRIIQSLDYLRLNSAYKNT